jgi:hypothetical protein
MLRRQFVKQAISKFKDCFGDLIYVGDRVGHNYKVYWEENGKRVHGREIGSTGTVEYDKDTNCHVIDLDRGGLRIKGLFRLKSGKMILTKHCQLL